jgi:hypothetical protein
MNNRSFVGFSCIFLLGILIFKGLTARRLYNSFGVKGLTTATYLSEALHNLLVGGEVLSIQRPAAEFQFTVLIKSLKSIHSTSSSYGRVLPLHPVNVQCLLTRALLVLKV